jgi:hypothetical protein
MHNLEQVEGPVTYKGKQHIDLQYARIKHTRRIILLNINKLCSTKF